MDFSIIKITNGEGYEDGEILFNTRTLEKFSFEQLAVLYDEIRNRMNNRIGDHLSFIKKNYKSVIDNHREGDKPE